MCWSESSPILIRSDVLRFLYIKKTNDCSLRSDFEALPPFFEWLKIASLQLNMHFNFFYQKYHRPLDKLKHDTFTSMVPLKGCGPKLNLLLTRLDCSKNFSCLRVALDLHLITDLSWCSTGAWITYEEVHENGVDKTQKPIRNVLLQHWRVPIKFN